MVTEFQLSTFLFSYLCPLLHRENITNFKGSNAYTLRHMLLNFKERNVFIIYRPHPILLFVTHQ